MGSGKTTVATEASRLSGLTCYDTDRMVETAAGMTIPEIFTRFGETTFRQLEHEAVCSLMKKDRFIASLGGGAVLFERNIAAIRAGSGILVWLDVPLAVINDRLASDSGRPLLDADMEKRTALYQSRLSSYQAAADLRLDGSMESLELAKVLIKEFSLEL